MYELKECDEALTGTELFEQEVQLRTVLDVLNYRVEHTGCTTKDACAALNVNYPTFMRWLNAGTLGAYLNQIHDPEMDMLRVRAIFAMPDILENMIEIASGKKVIRGVNPVAAATFVKSIIPPAPEVEETQGVTVVQNFFQPRTYNIPYDGAMPVIATEIVDAKVREVE